MKREPRVETVRWIATLFVVCVGTSLVGKGDGTFEERGPQRIEFTGHPMAIASGQFDGDGRRDLFVTRPNAGALVILSDPAAPRAWRSPNTLPVSNLVWHVYDADLDGDGFDDLLLSDPMSQGLVLWCNGKGTFVPSRVLPGVLNPRAMAAGDFDGDGLPDIVAAGHRSEDVSVLRGKGGRSFETLQPLPVGGGPYSIEVLDLDGDRRLDFVVGVDRDGFLLSRGLGNLEFAFVIAADWGIQCLGSVAVADFNHDGVEDLVTSCGVGLGDRNGSFLVPSPLLIDEAGSPTAADLDGDGHQDFVSTFARFDSGDWGPSSVVVRQGRGDGTLDEPFQLTVGAAGGFVPLHASDLDGDQRDEIVAGRSNGIAIVWDFWAAPTLLPKTQTRDVAITDIDRNGVPDILLPDSVDPVVSVFAGNALRGPARATQLLSTGNPFVAMAAEDLDGDGIVDLAGLDYTGSRLRIVLLDDKGAPRGTQSYPLGTQPRDVKALRVAGDALMDVVTLSVSPAVIAVFHGAGGGAFRPAQTVASLPSAKALAMDDLDRDGWVDAVVFSTYDIAVHWGNVEGGLDPLQALHSHVANRYQDLVIGDFDRDGFEDIAASSIGQIPGLRILKNLGQRTFAEPTTLKSQVLLGALAAKDLDGDGSLELVASTPIGASTSRVVVGRLAAEELAIAQTLDRFEPARALRLADFDGDGAQDLVVLGASGNDATVLYGNGDRKAGFFRRGDVDADGRVQVNDAVQVLSRLFLGGDALRCEDAADADDSGAIELNDPIRLLSFLLLAGEAPAAPGPQVCGADVAADALSCGAVCP